MGYKSTSVEVLYEELKKGVVTFEYTKKDGTVRTAKGTLNDELLPEKLPDQLSFDVNVIDTLMQAKSIPSLDVYAKENGLKYIGKSDSSYVFEPASPEKELSENVVRYYDIDKDHFRSFVKENFLGIL